MAILVMWMYLGGGLAEGRDQKDLREFRELTPGAPFFRVTANSFLARELPTVSKKVVWL